MVDILMSRDSDSPIVTREEDAVHEWFTSDRTFHIMRDHPAHCIFGFIMGCRDLNAVMISFIFPISMACSKIRLYREKTNFSQNAPILGV